MACPSHAIRNEYNVLISKRITTITTTITIITIITTIITIIIITHLLSSNGVWLIFNIGFSPGNACMRISPLLVHDVIHGRLSHVIISLPTINPFDRIGLVSAIQ